MRCFPRDEWSFPRCPDEGTRELGSPSAGGVAQEALFEAGTVLG
jgi:hypothetical protein